MTMTGTTNPTDFAHLFRTEFRSLAAFGTALSGSPSEGEEMAQEALARAFRHWSTLGDHPNIEGWLRRTLINLVNDKSRRQRYRPLRTDRPETVGEPPGTFDPRLAAAMAKLPRQQRAVVALRYLEDRSVDDIARTLEISASTVRVHLSRGRESLRQTLSADPTAKEAR